MNNKFFQEKSKLKKGLVLFASAITASAMLFASACDTTDDDGDTTSESTKRDTQVIRNGNFEFYNNGSDNQYLISSPDSWSRGSKGTTSYTMSGVIGTSNKAWGALTDDELAEKLDYNNELDKDDDNYDEEYVDYNGMHSYDIPYVDTRAAIDEDGDDYTDVIENPGTHYEVEKRGNDYFYTDAKGNEVQVYLNGDDGDYYTDADFITPMENSVLMIHNYLNTRNTSDNNKKTNFGTEQYYSSSTSITLEANTAAVFSVWVKTSNLYYGYNGEKTDVAQNRGAYIQIAQTVAGNALDPFYIRDINTEKLVDQGVENSNGWINYTIYVQGCDFASSTLTVTLGLGEQGAYKVEGYAFFDDLICTKYKSIDDTTLSTSAIAKDGGTGKYLDKENGGSTCTLLSDADDKIFHADKVTVNTEGSANVDARNSEDTEYFIDLASEGNHVAITTLSTNMGLTVDADNYVSSSANPQVYGSTTATYPTGAKFANGVNRATADDFLADIAIDANGAWANTLKTAIGANAYTGAIIDDVLKGALNTATALPGATDGQTAIMLSTQGAAYTTQMVFDGANGLEANSYRIVSFWVKTSDMNARTAATIKVTQLDDKNNTSSFIVDTTGLTTNIGSTDDEKDIFNGWAQCFLFLSNETDNAVSYKIEFCFGNTTIKGTTSSAYSYGWAALTNLRSMDVSKDEFNFATDSSRTASLTVSDPVDAQGNVFDTVYGSQAVTIKDKLATPANYKGVNGASANVIQNVTTVTEFDDTNKNAYAGLLNKEYIQNYIDNIQQNDWLDKMLKTKYTDYSSAIANAENVWNEVFGKSCNQPLLIVNTLRSFYTENANLTETAFNAGTYYVYENGAYVPATTYDESKTYYSFNKDAMNYGYIGKNKSVSAGSPTAISVKVKASKNAVAYVYLVSGDKSVMEFALPEYTFWYDDEGNVLKSEPKTDDDNYSTVENIAYKLRKDGLYQDSEGKLFANFFNLKKEYHNEHESYYTADGTQVHFDKLVDGETYFADAQGTKYSEHYLVTTDGDRVYSYKSGLGEDSVYYYFVDGYVNENYEVNGFDTTYAERRYTDGVETELFYEINTIENPELADKWITVNFFINGGTAAKAYRLELWSGARDEETTAGVADGSYVMFDYVYSTISSDEFTNLSGEYVNAIRQSYFKAINEYNKTAQEPIVIKSNAISLDELEELVDGKISVEKLYGYVAQYYTFSLYDSANYFPFNKETADTGETGYKYDMSAYSEKLAYLAVNDIYDGSEVKDDASLTTFIDYSAIEQTVEVGRIDDVEDDDDDSDTTATDGTNVWMLAASIILVVAIAIAMLSILIRDIVKRVRIKKSGKKNSNSYASNKRYVTTYTKANGEVPTKEQPEEKSEDAE